MATKTFKIGEYAKGGIIKAEILKNGKARISCLDYFDKTLLDEWEGTGYHALREALEDWTSIYYADQVLEWIKSKITLNLNRY